LIVATNWEFALSHARASAVVAAASGVRPHRFEVRVHRELVPPGFEQR
jgi:hypothetical protein